MQKVAFLAPVKDPRDSIDYFFDWTDFLADKEDTIAAVVISTNADAVESDGLDDDLKLTVGTPDFDDTRVIVRISGGEVGKAYMVTCEITTTEKALRVNRAAKLSVKDL